MVKYVFNVQQLAGINEIKVNKPGNIFKYCWIDSHSDYHQLNLATEQGYKNYIQEMMDMEDTTYEDVMSWEWASYVEEIKPSNIIFIGWNDEGPEVYDEFVNIYDFVQQIIVGYWGEYSFYEEFGVEEVDQFLDGIDKTTNLNKYLNKLKQYIDNSEADGDSSSANVLIINNKIFAGEENVFVL
jgi:hypothetical protein